MDKIIKLKEGECRNPHSLLGMKQKEIEGKGRLVVDVFCPDAKEVQIVHIQDKNKKYKLEQMDEEGHFSGIMGRRKNKFPYLVECTGEDGNTWSYVDPYQFDPLFSEFELYLFGEGTYYDAYKKLGAHYLTIDGVTGVYFAVWAPHAKRVSVIGDFNNWDGRRHTMRCIEKNGIWEIFIPGLVSGDVYKYEIKTQKDEIIYKADPYASWSELRPHNASRVYDMNQYNWKDSKWLKKRKEIKYQEAPISVYEMHLGSWRTHEDGSFYSYREIADNLATYLADMGYTHVELIGAMEHPFDGSWGYQVTGYFAPTSRYGTPDDFKYLIDKMHAKGIGVIIDWVPAHFPKDAFALEKFDGTALYEHMHPMQAEHPEWGTLIFNYGRHEVEIFLISSALNWLDLYHIDGLRVDAVSSMLYLDYGRNGKEYIPNKYGGRENLEAIDFIKKLNQVVHERHPGVMMIAEEATAWRGVTAPVKKGGLGFDFKWNMGWMNDYLAYIKEDPLFRKYHHQKITFSLMYAFNEQFVLPFSHDEVVHGKSCMIYKMPGDEWRKFANLRATYGYMFMHPGKKLLFMGDEFAQTSEWSEKKQLDWNLLQYPIHTQMQMFVKELNSFYKTYKCLWELDGSYEGFEWIDCDNADASVVAFIRKGKKEKDRLVIVVNFTPQVWKDYRIGIEDLGEYEEVLNSDAIKYGGSGVTNPDVIAEEQSWHSKPYSMSITVPPLSVSVFKLAKPIVPTPKSEPKDVIQKIKQLVVRNEK